MVFIAAAMFLANPGPPIVKYSLQLELVQPGFVVLSDLKMWLFHASSMAQSGFQFQIAKIQTAPVPKKVRPFLSCEQSSVRLRG
jgi:hypothetical protein